MNTKAIEAVAQVLLTQRNPYGQWDLIDPLTRTIFKKEAQTVLETARPHLEAEIRAEIAEEIRSEALNDLAANVLSKSPRDLERRQEIYYDLSARIAEGKS